MTAEGGRGSSRRDGCNPIIVNDTLFWEREGERHPQRAEGGRERGDSERKTQKEIEGAGLVRHTAVGGAGGGVVR